MRPDVTWVLSDTHYNHDRIATYCNRPENFTDLIIKNCKELIHPNDLVIHIGDVIIGNRRRIRDIMAELPGRWVLIRGNHDIAHSCDWWTKNGFIFACDAMIYRGIWFTHEPSPFLPPGCSINIFGHLHNFTKEVHPNYKALPFQRLFAIEYTGYKPVVLDKFVAKPDKYNARIHHIAENMGGKDEDRER